MIVSNGKKIDPGEIEEVLYMFPGVIKATVMGMPDASLGETVKAVIIMRKGITVSEADIIKFCGDYLADYKKPKSIEFCRVLPENIRS